MAVGASRVSGDMCHVLSDWLVDVEQADHVGRPVALCSIRGIASSEALEAHGINVAGRPPARW